MGVLQRFERRLGGLVEGAFAKVFKGGVEPVELAGALARECDDRKAVSATRSLVPNEFTIALSEQDYQRLAPYRTPSARSWRRSSASTRGAALHLRRPGHRPARARHELPLGIYRVDSSVGSAPGLAGPGAGRSRPRAARRSRTDGPASYSPAAAASAPGSRGGQGAETEYTLDQELVVLGRGSEADLRLSDTGSPVGTVRSADRRERPRYRDLGSTNGSKVNGKASTPAHPVRLRDGDRIELGKSSLVYRKDEQPRAGGGRQGGKVPARPTRREAVRRRCGGSARSPMTWVR